MSCNLTPRCSVDVPLKKERPGWVSLHFNVGANFVGQVANLPYGFLKTEAHLSHIPPRSAASHGLSG